MSESSTEIVQLSTTENMKEHPNVISENAEHAEDRGSVNDSEYDSAASYSEEEEEDKVRSRASDQDSQFEDENIVLERESGDGQESLPSKKIDDDEDKKNPQYIPKKGTFYEHDDRTADEPENPDVAENEKNEKDGRKKVWQDKKEKWSHDRFNESEQTPKSRTELIQIYGYDIRNEDGPPRARRRRRYGRGPNKYTRNWEDEEAYNRPPQNRVKKPLPSPPQKKNVNAAEEFPPLGSRKNKNQERNLRNKGQAEKQPQSDTEQATARQQPPEPPKTQMKEAKNAPVPSNKQQTNAPREQPPQHNQSQEHHNKQQVQRVGSGRVVKPQKEIKDSDYKGFTTKTRQYRSVKTEQKILPKTQKKEDHQIPNSAGKSSDTQDLEKDFCKMNIQEGSYKGNNKHNGNRLGSVPPRLQSEQKGSKRYSSIRQRSLPETTNPPFTQHSTYYAAEYTQAQAVQPQPQPLIQSAPVPQGVPPILPAPIQIGPQQVPVTATPILQGPPQYPPPQFPQQQFLQPAVAPPPFIAQQQPQLINYVQSQPQFPQSFQGYQQQFTPIVSQSLNILETQPPELYQPQGGITYYSADQQIAQRAMPQKRPKAAIPIVAPPSQNGRESSRKEEDQMIEHHDHPTEHNSGGANYVIEESLPVSYVKEAGAVEEQ